MVAQELYTAVWSLGKRERKRNDNINVDVSVNEIDGARLGQVCRWTLLSTTLNIRARRLQRNRSYISSVFAEEFFCNILFCH